MSIQLKKVFRTHTDALACAQVLMHQSQTHHVQVTKGNLPDVPFEVQWVEECDLEDRYEIHPPNY